MRNNNYYYIRRAAWPVILTLASLTTATRAGFHNMHHNDCRPLMAFNSHQRSHYSTFQQKQQQRRRKLTFLCVGKESNSQQDETIEISSSPIISKITSIAHKITSSKKAKGRAILLLVSFLYGTLNVTLRAIYASDGAPTASVLSLVRQCLSVLTFIPIIASVNSRSNAASEEDDLETKVGNTSVEEKESNSPMWLAAAELAFWNCGAQVSKTHEELANNLKEQYHRSIGTNLFSNRVLSMQGYCLAPQQEHPS